MKKQTDQQQKTHGKTTKHINNKDNDTELLSLKAGYNQHASPSRDVEHYFCEV